MVQHGQGEPAADLLVFDHQTSRNQYDFAMVVREAVLPTLRCVGKFLYLAARCA